MLILKEGEVYFLDRDNSVFTSEKFTFPRRKYPDQHLFDTLVDGVSNDSRVTYSSSWYFCDGQGK